MKITVMGPGGVGGYFGARLAAAGNDVTFVARGAHLEAMQAKGLRLDSDIGNLHLNPVKVVADARDIPAADAIIFAVKMRDTESAAESLRPLVAKGAAIFTFQNGVESAERIGRIVGAGNVVEGAARIASNIPEPGVIKQIGKFAILEFGERDGKPSARTTAFHAACVAAGINATLSDNISRTLWLKFAMLAPVAGMTALTRGPLGPIRRHPRVLRAAEGGGGGDGCGRRGTEDGARARRCGQDHQADRRASERHDGLHVPRPAGRQTDRGGRFVGRGGATGHRRTAWRHPRTRSSQRRWRPSPTARRKV